MNVSQGSMARFPIWTSLARSIRTEPGWPGHGEVIGSNERFLNISHVHRAKRSLGRLAVRDADDVECLERFWLGGGRAVSRDRHDRTAVAKGVGQRRDQIGGAGARRRGAKSGLATRRRVAFRLEPGALLVSGQNVAKRASDVGKGQGIVEWQTVAPRNAKDKLDANEFHELHDEVGAGDHRPVQRPSVAFLAKATREVPSIRVGRTHIDRWNRGYSHLMFLLRGRIATRSVARPTACLVGG